MGPMKWLMETRIENQVVPSRQAGTMEKGRTPRKLGRRCFAGDGSVPFPWTGGASRPGKNCRVAHVRRAPLHPESVGARATRGSTGCHVASGDNARPLPNPLWCLRGLHPSSSVSSASGPAIASSQSRTRITTTRPHHPMSICISSLQSPTAPVVSALQRRSQGHARPDRGIVQKTPPAMHAAHQQSK